VGGLFFLLARFGWLNTAGFTSPVSGARCGLVGAAALYLINIEEGNSRYFQAFDASTADGSFHGLG
jgi:hypothetical protein